MSSNSLVDLGDDDLSYCGSYTGSIGEVSRCSSRGSRGFFTAGFNIDWEEIDSIAEDTLSVSSHAPRKSMGSRRRSRPNLADDEISYSSFSSYTSSGNTSISNASRTSARSGGILKMGKHNRSGSQGSLRGIRDRTCSQDSSFGLSGSNHNRGYFSHTLRNRRNHVYRYWKATRKFVGRTPALFILLSFVVTTFVTLRASFSIINQRAPPSLKPSNPHDVAYIDNEGKFRRFFSRQTKPFLSRPWPVSVRDEQDSFVIISHPATGTTNVTLSVPRFYLSGVDGSMQSFGNGKLPTRSIVDLIGRTSMEGKSKLRAADNQPQAEIRTIFIGIASYRDSHCRYTVESAFAKARYPERLRIGVVDQIISGTDQSCDIPIVNCETQPYQALCNHRHQIDVYEMEANLAVGPIFARHVVNRLYRGEYYTLQLDSHVVFAQDWDVDIVSQISSTNNEMAIVTNYLDDVSGSIDSVTGRSLRVSRQVLCNAAYEGSGPDRRLRHDAQQQPSALSPIHGSPQLQPYWAAGFSFSRGHFILRVPYDPYVAMVQKEDEEISIALRAFTHGYDFYTPERSVAFDSSLDSDKNSFLQHKHLYVGHEAGSLQRLYGLIGMDTDDGDPADFERTLEFFGMGKVREASKFFNTFGIHVREKITERRLCDYVSTGRMQKQCSPFLRRDGMGIDYNQINFRFHELQNNHDNGR